MAKIKITFRIDKSSNSLYIETAKIGIIIHDTNPIECSIVKTKDIPAYHLTNIIELHELLFMEDMKYKIKESIERIEYSIKNNLHRIISFVDIYVYKEDFDYTFKVLNQLKDLFGELSIEEKMKFRVPLDDRRWVLKNVCLAYQSISEEMKCDKEILSYYVDIISEKGLVGVEEIPFKFLNDEEFLKELRNKVIKYCNGNKLRQTFSLSAKLLKHTKLFETFKDLIVESNNNIFFNIGG